MRNMGFGELGLDVEVQECRLVVRVSTLVAWE